jgi:hypothetical protein
MVKVVKIFENNCKGFAFLCRLIKENPARGGVA